MKWYRNKSNGEVKLITPQLIEATGTKDLWEEVSEPTKASTELEAKSEGVVDNSTKSLPASPAPYLKPVEGGKLSKKTESKKYKTKSEGVVDSAKETVISPNQTEATKPTEDDDVVDVISKDDL